MAATLTLKIVTPEKVVFEETAVDSLTVPTAEGEITILPNHIPLVTQVIPGEMLIRQKGKETYLVVTNGFLKLTKEGSISLLTDYAIRSEDIQIAKVQEAKRRAEEAIKAKISQRDFAVAEAELRRTLLEMKVAQRRKSPKVSV